jgi:hypothetical protein
MAGRGYEMLRDVLPLPSSTTLRKVKEAMPTGTGFTSFMRGLLIQRSSQLEPADRYAAICFDGAHLDPTILFNKATDQKFGMPDLGEYLDCLTPKQRKVQDGGRIANNVDLWMLTGCRLKYSYPIQYYLSANTTPGTALAPMIKKTIQNVRATGFRVHVTVSDGGSSNVAALKELGVLKFTK